MPYVVYVSCPSRIDPARFAAVWDDFGVRTVSTTTNSFQACAALPDPSDPDGTSLRVMLGGTVRCEGAMFACAYPPAVSSTSAGEPWFAASFVDEAQETLQLAASYGSSRVMRNVIDMVSEARTIARHLGGRALDFDHTELDDARVEDIASGARNRTLIGAAVARLDEKVLREPYARLELPVGTNDVVSDYLLFHVRPWKKATAAAIEQVLAGAGVGPMAVFDTQFVVSLADPPPIVKKLKLPPYAVNVMLRDDGVIQLRAGGYLAFQHHVEAVVRCAERLHEAFGGDVLLAGQPFADLEPDLRAAAKSGLGLDLFLAVVRRNELVWQPRA